MTRVLSGTKPPAMVAAAAESIVRVGGGRGFVIEAHRERLIVTAAHCLPSLPPANPAMYFYEKTFAQLVGPLGGRRSIYVECAFVDPISDVAVLCAPERQSELFKQAEAYERFVADRAPIPIRWATSASDGWLYDLKGRWHSCSLTAQNERRRYTPIQVEDRRAIAVGTSGSPVFDQSGVALALVSTGSALNPILGQCLPQWIMRATSAA